MKMNNRGIARIIEATVAVLIIFSVLFIVSDRNLDNDVQSLNSLIIPLLEEISKNESLRGTIINDPVQGEADVLVFLGEKITRPDLNYSVKICGASEFCSLGSFPETRDGNVYSEERIISTDLTSDQENLEFKKIKIFLWRK